MNFLTLFKEISIINVIKDRLIKMTITGFIKLSLAISLMYITAGDKVLPQAYGNKSLEVRSNINQYLISLFPDNELETIKKDRFTIEG